MNQLLTDVRSGLRMLVKYPTLSIVAILTLGLGIGLSTTVFCVINGGLFKGLPFPDGGSNRRRRRHEAVAESAAATDQRSGSCRLDESADIVRKVRCLLVRTDEPVHRRGPSRTIQWRPADRCSLRGARRCSRLLGRGFREGDDRTGAEPVVILGHDLWRDRYASSPDIVGKTIRASGVPANGHRRDAGQVRLSDPRSAVGAARHRPNAQRTRPGSDLPGHRAPEARRQHRAGENPGGDDCRTTRKGIPGNQSRASEPTSFPTREPFSARRFTGCSTRCSVPASACC